MNSKKVKYPMVFIAIIAMSCTILFSLENNIKSQLKQKTSGQIGKINKLLKCEDFYEVTYWGSSTTLVHLSPSIIDPILKTKSYNYGLDGTFFQQYAGLLKNYAYKAKPSVFVIGINVTTFHPRTALYKPEHYTYAVNNKMVSAALQSVDLWTTWKMRWVPFYSLTLFDENLYATIAEENIDSLAQLTGFSGSDETRFLQHGPFPYDSIEIRREFVVEMKTVVTELQKMGHVPVLVISPMYHEGLAQIKNIQHFESVLNEFQELEVPIFNYLDSDISQNKELFYNYLHLNMSGAALYSEQFASDILPLVKDFRERNSP